jgi:hypothetical protein
LASKKKILTNAENLEPKNRTRYYHSPLRFTRTSIELYIFSTHACC